MKECPFCRHIHHRVVSTKSLVFVECGRCKARGPVYELPNKIEVIDRVRITTEAVCRWDERPAP